VANGDAVDDKGFRRMARLWDRTFLEFGSGWHVPDAGDVDVGVRTGGAVICWNPSAWSNVSTLEALFVSETEGWPPLLRESRAAMAASNGRLLILIGRSCYAGLGCGRPSVQCPVDGITRGRPALSAIVADSWLEQLGKGEIWAQQNIHHKEGKVGLDESIWTGKMAWQGHIARGPKGLADAAETSQWRL
jgi:hypothetical protein